LLQYLIADFLSLFGCFQPLFINWVIFSSLLWNYFAFFFIQLVRFFLLNSKLCFSPSTIPF
jgi:hypothetical protein